MSKLFRESDDKEFKWTNGPNVERWNLGRWNHIRSKEGNDVDLVKHIGRSRFQSIDDPNRTYREVS